MIWSGVKSHHATNVFFFTKITTPNFNRFRYFNYIYVWFCNMFVVCSKNREIVRFESSNSSSSSHTIIIIATNLIEFIFFFLFVHLPELTNIPHISLPFHIDLRVFCFMFQCFIFHHSFGLECDLFSNLSHFYCILHLPIGLWPRFVEILSFQPRNQRPVLCPGRLRVRSTQNILMIIVVVVCK